MNSLTQEMFYCFWFLFLYFFMRLLQFKNSLCQLCLIFRRHIRKDWGCASVWIIFSIIHIRHDVIDVEFFLHVGQFAGNHKIYQVAERLHHTLKKITSTLMIDKYLNFLPNYFEARKVYVNSLINYRKRCPVCFEYPLPEKVSRLTLDEYCPSALLSLLPQFPML